MKYPTKRITAGDIGENPREVEYEPLEAPVSIPEPVKIPEPVLEPV